MFVNVSSVVKCNWLISRNGPVSMKIIIIILIVRGKTLRFSQDVSHVNSKCRSDVPNNSKHALETIAWIATAEFTTSAGLDKVY